MTHSLTGATIYYLGFRRKFAMVVLILASIAPNFDYVTRLWGMDIFLRYHRGITHGILFLFIAPLIIGLIFGLRKGFLYYTFIAFLGYTAHLLLDLGGAFGRHAAGEFGFSRDAGGRGYRLNPEGRDKK